MFKFFSPSLSLPRKKSSFPFEGQRGGVAYFFCQKADKFLVTIDIGKKDRMELASALHWVCLLPGEGKEGATGFYRSEGWRLLVCLHHLSLDQWLWVQSWALAVLKAALSWLGLPYCKERWFGLGLPCSCVSPGLTATLGDSRWYPMEGIGE